jgi:hypothetical protein
MYAFNPSVARGMAFRMRGIWAAMPFPTGEPEILYVVTGNPDPDCKGNYVFGGTHNGKPYYKREDSGYYIFWHTLGISAWIINPTLGQGWWGWFRQEAITGTYTPLPPATGNPVVSEA